MVDVDCGTPIGCARPVGVKAGVLLVSPPKFSLNVVGASGVVVIPVVILGAFPPSGLNAGN